MPKGAPVNTGASLELPWDRDSGYRRCRPNFTVGRRPIPAAGSTTCSTSCATRQRCSWRSIGSRATPDPGHRAWHDLGVTEHANGDQRFEVDGADAAARFLRDRGVQEERVVTVWQAIALHTSVGLAHRFGSVHAVTHLGIGTDIVGTDREMLPPGSRIGCMRRGHVMTSVMCWPKSSQPKSRPTRQRGIR
jgi:hypothetical protein